MKKSSKSSHVRSWNEAMFDLQCYFRFRFYLFKHYIVRNQSFFYFNVEEIECGL